MGGQCGTGKKALKIAGSFHKGLNQGDHVAICLSQRPETIISHLATWKIGAVSVPLTVLFGPDGLKFRLQHSEAKIAIVEDMLLDTLRSIKGQLKDLAFPALFYGKPVLAHRGGGKFEPEKTFKLIQDYGITVAYIPPTGLRMMRRVSNPGERFDLSSIRVLVSGGGYISFQT